MAKYKDQEFLLELRLKNEPGVFNLGLCFHGEQTAFDTWVAKWPKAQNELVHFHRATWHTFTSKDGGYDVAECEFSPTGYCQRNEEMRYQEWHPDDANDLYFSVADILAKCEMYVTNEESQEIWDRCVLFWNTPAMAETRQIA